MISLESVGVELIVITGPRGSGKTVLSRFLSYALGLPTRNVGDALLRELRRRYGKAFQVERRHIGPVYFENFTLSDYLFILDDLTRTPCVLDGVRLADGIEHLRNRCSLLHIHCHFGRDVTGSNVPVTEPYRNDLFALAESADYHVRRMNDLPGLQNRIRRLLELLQEITGPYGK